MAQKLDTYCVIGAGASGIAAGKVLKAFGIPFEIIEREDDVGGNWYYGKPNSSVYNSAHLISSKTLSGYTDFPMPADYPDYPNHTQVLAYLRSYARHFGLYKQITFNTSVEQVERTDDGLWDVRLDNGETHRYKGLVIANGHHWDPKYPDYPGVFNGTSIHSADYKTPDLLRGKRVLVVGAGNSGCDIAVESAQNAAKTFHSMRRGYWFVPKYLFGYPTDVVNEVSVRLGTPVWMRRLVNRLILRVFVGDMQRYGLRKPDHPLLSAHPLVNQQIMYFLGHGKIIPKPDIAELCGDSVRFQDGSIEVVDVIVYATGFNISFPFIDPKHLNWRDNHPDLYLHIFHREYDNLFVMGMIQPDSGQFWIVDMQAQLMAKFIRAMDSGSPAADQFRRIKASAHPDMGGGIQHLKSARHALEIEHHSYRRLLKRLMKRFDAA